MNKRLSILQTIVLHAPVEVSANLMSWIYAYKEIDRLTEKRDFTSADVSPLIGSLVITNSFNVAVCKLSILEKAWEERWTNVIEALLESPEFDLAQTEKNTGLNFCYLISKLDDKKTEANSKYLISVLESVPALAKLVSGKMLTTRSEHPYSAITNFSSTPASRQALLALITANPKIAEEITVDSLLVRVPVAVEGEGIVEMSVFSLLSHDSDLIKKIFEINPALIEQIPVEVFTETPKTTKVYIPPLLTNLYLKEKHATILESILNKKPELAQQITVEMLTKLQDKEDDYVRCGFGFAKYIDSMKVLFKILKLNPVISTQITKEILCNPYPDGRSLLFALAINISSQQVLKLLLKQNETLTGAVTSEAFFRSSTGRRFAEFSPFQLLAAAEYGHDILLFILSMRPDLVPHITKIELSRIPTTTAIKEPIEQTLSRTPHGKKVLEIINDHLRKVKLTSESKRDKEEIGGVNTKRQKAEEKPTASIPLVSNPAAFYAAPSEKQKRARSESPPAKSEDEALEEILKFAKTGKFDDEPDDPKNSGKTMQ